MSDPIKNRYEFVLLFDVKDGNPNGDPDAGNLPRIDPETGNGLVTDVCLKRKVRNYVGLVHGEQPPYEIYVKEKAVLNRQHERAYQAFELKPESKKLPKNEEDARKITGWMCKNFFDVRAFGAVMSTEVNAGQVRGPVQFAFGRSIDRVFTGEHSITRMAVTNEKDLEKEREARGLREKIAGYGREEVIGRTALEIGIWADRAERDALVEALRRDGEVRNREVRFRRGAGGFGQWLSPIADLCEGLLDRGDLGIGIALTHLAQQCLFGQNGRSFECSPDPHADNYGRTGIGTGFLYAVDDEILYAVNARRRGQHVDAAHVLRPAPFRDGRPVPGPPA